MSRQWKKSKRRYRLSGEKEGSGLEVNTKSQQVTTNPEYVNMYYSRTTAITY
jgi:hypothetical protein